MITRCKDCDSESTDLYRDYKYGWRPIDIVDGNDPINGWRCPHCAAGWDIICERLDEPLH